MIESKMNRWAGDIACMGENRNTCNVLMGKPERKRQLRRFRHRWKDATKMVLRETGWVYGLVHLARDLMNTVIHLLVPIQFGELLERLRKLFRALGVEFYWYIMTIVILS
jgi:hypothetical protein